MGSINGWTHEQKSGNVQFIGSGPAFYKCASCGTFVLSGDKKLPYGCTVASNETAAAACAANRKPDGCKHYFARGNKPMVSQAQFSGGSGSTARNFADTMGITTDMKNFERLANDSGAGLAVGAAKFIGGAIAKEAAKEKAEDARKEAERQFQQAQEDAEKEAVSAAIKSIDLGKDAVSIAGGITALLEIIAAYRYELDFPYGPKGPCLGTTESYKKDLWKQAAKKAEKGIEQLRKQGAATEADNFLTQLQAEQDNVDPKIVKERLLAEKAEAKQAKAEERAEKAAERAEKTAEFKEKAGATMDEIKKDGIGGFLGKKLESLGGSASGKADELTDKFKQGIGGLGGFFGKKK
jgi:hypothetical protein